MTSDEPTTAPPDPPELAEPLARLRLDLLEALASVHDGSQPLSAIELERADKLAERLQIDVLTARHAIWLGNIGARVSRIRFRLSAYEVAQATAILRAAFAKAVAP